MYNTIVQSSVLCIYVFPGSVSVFLVYSAPLGLRQALCDFYHMIVFLLLFFFFRQLKRSYFRTINSRNKQSTEGQTQ